MSTPPKAMPIYSGTQRCNHWPPQPLERALGRAPRLRRHHDKRARVRTEYGGNRPAHRGTSTHESRRLDQIRPPDVVQIVEVEKPVPEDNEVLLKVCAASVNPLDGGLMKGRPYIVRIMTGLRKPKITRPGVDVAGKVEAAGLARSSASKRRAFFGLVLSIVAPCAEKFVDSKGDNGLLVAKYRFLCQLRAFSGKIR
jgi:hypothetical protein